MSYDRRKDGVYLLTGEKHDNKDIVIKMGSIINEMTLIETFSRESYELKWILEENQEEGLLTLKGEVNDQEFLFDLNKSIVVRQFTKMIKENKALESCTYLSVLMQKSFDVVFEYFLKQKGEILCSNNPVSAYIEVHSTDKILGAASRFNFTSDGKLQLYEYTGKEIKSEDDLTFYVVIDDVEIKMAKTSLNRQGHNIETFNPNDNVLGYLSMPVRIVNVHEGDLSVEVPEMELLPQIPMSFSNPDDMNGFIVTSNSPNEITAYKMSLRPKAKLININKFMLREFTI